MNSTITECNTKAVVANENPLHLIAFRIRSLGDLESPWERISALHTRLYEDMSRKVKTSKGEFPTPNVGGTIPDSWTKRKKQAKHQHHLPLLPAGGCDVTSCHLESPPG